MGYCRNCGTKLDEGVKFCPECGTAAFTNDHEPTRESKEDQAAKKNICPKCGGTIKYEMVTEEENRSVGCLGSVLIIAAAIALLITTGRLILTIIVVGVAIVIVGMTSNTDKKTVLYGICQECGYREKVNNDVSL